jgi:transposase
MRPLGTVEQLESRRRRAVHLFKTVRNYSAVGRMVGAAASSVLRWVQVYQTDGRVGLDAHRAPGRPPRLSPHQKKRLVRLLLQGPRVLGYRTELWTLKRMARLIRCKFQVPYHPGHVWKLLTQLGWSCQKPERRALPRDEKTIAHWKRYVWPQIKKKLGADGHTWFSLTKAAFCSFRMSGERGHPKGKLPLCIIKFAMANFQPSVLSRFLQNIAASPCIYNSAEAV